MKIVDYKEFVNLPKYTIYAEYNDCIIGDLSCKGDVINNNSDWFYSQITNNPEYDSDIFSEAFQIMENGGSVEVDMTTLQRDGMFDFERKFIVYEKNDVKEFIEKLEFCMSEAYDKN